MAVTDILRRITGPPRNPYGIATPPFAGGSIPGITPSADWPSSVYASAAPPSSDAVIPNSPPPLSAPTPPPTPGAAAPDPDLERLKQIYRQGAPAPPQHGRLGALLEGLGSKFIPNAQAVLHPEYTREMQDYQRALQSAGGAAKAAQEESALGYQRALTGHLQAETANMPAMAIESATRSGWRPDENQSPAAGGPPPLVSPDADVAEQEQAAAASPLQNRPAPKGAALTIGGVKGHFQTAGEKRTEEEAAKQTNWQEVTPEMAAKLPDMVQPGMKVPPNVFMGLERLIAKQSQSPKLEYEKYTNEINGDVTVIGRDPSTGSVKFQQVLKGIAPKRPSIAMMGGGLSDDAIELEARKYLQTGQMPALGMGGSQMKQRILDRAAAIAKAENISPTDVATQGAQFKAGAGSLTSLQKQQQAVMAFERTATANLDLATNISSQVDRTGSPLLNHYLLYLKGQVAGDSQTIKLQNAVRTAANEYAKVISGSMGNTAVTDSLRRETEDMLNASFSKGTFNEVVGLMKQEMNNRKAGYTAQIQELTQGLRNKPGTANGASGNPSVVQTPNGAIDLSQFHK